MTAINLNRYRQKNLEIRLGKHTYTAKPPTTEVMTVILALVKTSSWYALTGETCPSCGRVKEDPPEEWTDVLAKHTADDLPDLMFGKTTVKTMNRNKVPKADIDMASMYAMWHWAYGPEAARSFMDNVYTDPREAAGEPAPKAAPASSNNGPHMA